MAGLGLAMAEAGSKVRTKQVIRTVNHGHADPRATTRAKRERRFIVRIARLLLLLAAVGAGWWGFAASSQAQLSLASPMDEESAEKRRNEIDFFVRIIRQDKLDLTDRMNAARTLLDRDWPEGHASLVQLLSPSEEIATRRAVAQALARRPEMPPSVYAEPLIQLLNAAESPLLEDVASALGRMSANGVGDHMTQLAMDAEARQETRRGAILALGQLRTRQAAATLIRLVSSPNQPETLRDAAFQALARLSGIEEFGHDLERWTRWWRQHQRLSDAQWYARLIEHYAHRNTTLAEQSRKLEERVAQAQQALYLATPADQRQALLVRMLDDPLESIRRLAVNLAGQQAVTPEGLSKPLRDALRRHLDDNSSIVREATSRVLKDLFDEEAAKVMAQRLRDGQESDPSVLRNYLLMMAKLPQAEAVGPMLDLLGQPQLQDQAASALVPAVDAGLVSDTHRTQAATVVRLRVAGSDQPPPGFVELLGRLGNAEDWKQIEGWLTHGDSKIRESAARAWRHSDQPVLPLARHAADPVIQPFFYAAAGARGSDAAVLEALIDNQPRDDALRDAWRTAIVNVAGKAAPTAVLGAAATLAARDEPEAFRRRVLTAAIEQLRAVAADPSMLTPLQRTTLVDLLLARGELALAGGDPQGAQTDFLGSDAVVRTHTPTNKRRRDMGIVGVHLAMNDLASATQTAESMLKAAAEAERAALKEQLGIVFMQAIQRVVRNGERERGQRLLSLYSSLVGTDPAPAIRERIKAMGDLVKPPGDGTTGATDTG